MIEFKTGTVARVPVVLKSASTGAPLTGVNSGAVVCTVEKADGSTAAISVSGGDWQENSAGAFSTAGIYSLLLPTSALSQVGPLKYAVAVSSADVFVGLVKVVPDDILATASALSAVATNVNDIEAMVNRLNSFHSGKWKVFAVGPDANRIVYYAEDGVTVLAKFDLKDISGAATYKAAFERVPV